VGGSTADPSANTDFTSASQDRVSSTAVPLLEPAHLVSLPKGQAFSFQEGGQLWKVRIPLPKPAADDAMPDNLQELARLMRASYNDNAGQWWRATSSTTALPPQTLDNATTQQVD
jgi:hypothetical protein